MDYPLYKVNGTLLTLQPESGNWVERNELGMDGGGHVVYQSPREYEISWGLMTPSEFAQIQNLYNLVGNSGTISVDLPHYGSATYEFWTYSGCTMSEPTMGEFYEEQYKDVSIKFYKIRG